MQITITGTENTTRKLQDLGKLSASVVPVAKRKAIRSGQVRAVRDTALVLNLPSSRIRKQIQAKQESLQIRDLDREKPPTLLSFRGKFIMQGRRSAGYRVRIWKGLGNKHIKQAFKIPRSEIPFTKGGGPRETPMKPLFGPRVGVVFDTIHISLRDFMRDRVTLEWRKSIRGRLARR